MTGFWWSILATVGTAFVAICGGLYKLYGFLVSKKNETIELYRVRIEALELKVSEHRDAPNRAMDILLRDNTILAKDNEKLESHNARLLEKIEEYEIKNTPSGIVSKLEVREVVEVASAPKRPQEVEVKSSQSSVVQALPSGGGEIQSPAKIGERNALINAIVKYIGVERIRQANDASFVRAWNAMIEEWRHHPMHPPVPINCGAIDRLIEVGMVEGTDITPLGISMIRSASRNMGEI